jgi:mRNA-degrading endonuclease RelE of RelBE toxin-antitoxin system
MVLMSDAIVQLQFTPLFKRRLKGLAKKYRQIQTDIQPMFGQIGLGNFIGEQIAGMHYTVYKVRAKNSDAQSGKSGGYRLIYQIESPTRVILHLIYAKSDQATVSADEIQRMVEDFYREQAELPYTNSM